MIYYENAIIKGIQNDVMCRVALLIKQKPVVVCDWSCFIDTALRPVIVANQTRFTIQAQLTLRRATNSGKVKYASITSDLKSTGAARECRHDAQLQCTIATRKGQTFPPLI
jgi:hypothetical protein